MTYSPKNGDMTGAVGVGLVAAGLATPIERHVYGTASDRVAHELKKNWAAILWEAYRGTKDYQY